MFSFPVGFIGDKIGYKFVLVYGLVSAAICQTAYLFLPPFSQTEQNPYAILAKGNASDIFVLQHIYWPLCQVEVTDDACAESEPFQSDAFANISSHWSCSDLMDHAFDSNFILDLSNSTELSNGTFCHATPDHNVTNPDLAVICYISGDYAESCQTVEGNHALTFWLYFGFYCVYTLGMNIGFALLDSTALHLADQHDSHYSYIMIWIILGAVLAPIISALAIEAPEEGGKCCLLYTSDAADE